ncbi:MAG: NADH-quinone oxidoreductase subunit J [Thermoleophilia bacterium]|nr:NADH-quinone oxidoreductase subunit J [Thermoleophilia bacterium]
MEFSPIPFYIVSALVIICAIAMIYFKELIYSALSMVACFMAIAGIYILLNAELVAGAQVLIYVAAISILVIFAIMLTRHRKGDFWLFFHRQSVVTLPFVVVAGIVLTVVLATAAYDSSEEALNPPDEEMARLLFQDYSFPFEVLSLVLLVAIMGAILLAMRERRR